MALFYPTIYRRRITDITVEMIHAQGVKGILLDVDNTLTTHDNPQVSPAVTAWLDAMRAAGVALTVVSNNSDARVRPFAEKIGLEYQAKAAKPLPRGGTENGVAAQGVLGSGRPNFHGHSRGKSCGDAVCIA